MFEVQLDVDKHACAIPKLYYVSVGFFYPIMYDVQLTHKWQFALNCAIACKCIKNPSMENSVLRRLVHPPEEENQGQRLG